MFVHSVLRQLQGVTCLLADGMVTLSKPSSVRPISKGKSAIPLPPPPPPRIFPRPFQPFCQRLSTVCYNRYRVLLTSQRTERLHWASLKQWDRDLYRKGSQQYPLQPPPPSTPTVSTVLPTSVHRVVFVTTVTGCYSQASGHKGCVERA